MRCEIVSIGSEQLLGQLIDTNAPEVAQSLAEIGIDCNFRQTVGDNLERIISVLTIALDRSDAVIVTGGLGPTHDDLTRDAVAKMVGVELVHDEVVAEKIREMFSSRGREMVASNLRQALVPVGAEVIEQRIGTAPGLICLVGDKPIYLLPGVPHEMREMLARAVLPDLSRRNPSPAVVLSRTLRTWGIPESTMGELIAPRIEALDTLLAAGEDVPTIALLASAREGIKVRLTVRAADVQAAEVALEGEVAELRALIGNAVFGLDNDSLETVVGQLCLKRGWTIGTAESLTGGLLAQRLTAIPGASDWFKGSIVAYASEVKYELLGVERGPVVSAEAAVEMADGVCRALGCDVGLALTGVAGPDRQEDHEPGTVFIAVACPGAETTARHLRVPGDRTRVREFAATSVLDLARRTLTAGHQR